MQHGPTASCCMGVWNEDLDGKWNRHFDEMTSFYNRVGEFPNNHSKEKDERKLGKWLNDHKYFNKDPSDKRCVPWRRQTLIDLGAWDDDVDDKWNHNFD